MTKYQIGFETLQNRKTGIPARFAILSREACERQFPDHAVRLILDEGKTWTSESGTVFYLHSTFHEN